MNIPDERVLHNKDCEWPEFFEAYPDEFPGRKWKLCTSHIEYIVKYEDALPRSTTD